MNKEKPIRVEMHLYKDEVALIDKLAKKDGRSRKNFCETVMRKLIL